MVTRGQQTNRHFFRCSYLLRLHVNRNPHHNGVNIHHSHTILHSNSNSNAINIFRTIQRGLRISNLSNFSLISSKRNKINSFNGERRGCTGDIKIILVRSTG